jgi:hypothetical protein
MRWRSIRLRADGGGNLPQALKQRGELALLAQMDEAADAGPTDTDARDAG